MTASADDSIQSFTHLHDFVGKNNHVTPSENLGSEIWQLSEGLKLKKKATIESGKKKMRDLPIVHICRGLTTGYNKAFIIDSSIVKAFINSNKTNKDIIKPLLQGLNIRKWIYLDSTSYIL